MSTAEAPSGHWLWLQHRDIAPGAALNFRDDLLATAFGQGHGTADGPRPLAYAFAVGRDVETEGVEAWFLARPDLVDDGELRYWVEYGTGTRVVRDARPLNADEAHEAFRTFLDALERQ